MYKQHFDSLYIKSYASVVSRNKCIFDMRKGKKVILLGRDFESTTLEGIEESVFV